ncbi:hypothetical protein [Salinimicrobium sp. WS361]|uniref:hypothetical protein n=1 Tax=Salinimicrobium sp. WS361 TaxID=3425123 RepID=UPI003D701067
MGKRGKYQIILVLLAGLTFGIYFQGAYAQDSENPPPPMMQSTQASTTDNGCGETEDDGTGSPPPPPGFCLPINDYLLPLFLSGVALGAFQLFRLRKKEEELKDLAE